MQSKESIPLQGRRSFYGGIVGRSEHSRLRKTETSKLTSADIAGKCQAILTEIDRCSNFNEKYIESSVLHDVPQMFVPSELRVALEDELDTLLTEKLLREERIHARSSLPSDTTAISFESPSDNSKETVTLIQCGHEWTPCYDAIALVKRRKELNRELKAGEKHEEGDIIQSTVARSAMNGGDLVFQRDELIKELSDEIQQIDAKLMLSKIDEELHRVAFASIVDEMVTIRSIHGYDQVLPRRAALAALDFEHNRLVAKIISVEIVDDILQWMLAGWYFGERDTKDENEGWMIDLPVHDQRGSLSDKASGVQQNSNANAIRNARSNLSESTTEDLRGVETTMKYGLFCLTFMYFKALHTLRKEKKSWDGSNDLISLRHGPPLSEERKKMIQEQNNAAFRRTRMEYAMDKARAGESRWRQRSERERLERAKIRQFHNKKKQAEHKFAVNLQRVFRGYLGRRYAKACSLERDSARTDELLKNACATDIARVWRGYCGRIDAGYLRAAMARFLFTIRQEEARDEEEEFLALQRRFV